jgi:hypothetical protein
VIIDYIIQILHNMSYKDKILTTREKMSELLVKSKQNIESLINSKVPYKFKQMPKGNNLEMRIERYNIIQYKINEGNIKPLKSTDCLEEAENSTYKIRDILTLVEKIGSQSIYGTIYKTNIHNSQPIYIATKVMESRDNNKIETILMKSITKQLILTKKSKHFLIMYCYSYCDRLKNTPYALANFNELADNDLKYYLLNTKNILDDKLLLYNILIQSLISIGSFHNLVGYIHEDCHWGNFLYLENTEHRDNTYYMYKFKNVIYYLKSCKYNIMIYDFGLSSNILLYKDYRIINNLIVEDYQKIIGCFIYIMYSDEKVSTLFDMLDNTAKESNIYQSQYDAFLYIFAKVLHLCLHNFPEIFLSDIKKLPSGSIILNKIPYELFSKEKISLDYY